MSDQPPSYGHHHERYSPSTLTPPPQVPTHQNLSAFGSGGQSLDLLLAWAAPMLSLILAVLPYALLRWAPEPVETTLVTSGTGLVVLAACGFLAARRGVVAPYVAAALLLPFAVAASAGLGSADRINNEVKDLLADQVRAFDSATEGWSSTPDTPIPDPDESAVAVGSTGEFGGFEITLNSMECGLTKIDGTAENPAYYDSEDAEPHMTAKAASGTTFCVVASTWRNASKEPATLGSHETFSGLLSSDGVEFAPTSDDDSYSYAITREAGYDGSILNPGDSAEIRSVFSLPEPTTVKYLKAAGFLPEDGITYFKAPVN